MQTDYMAMNKSKSNHALMEHIKSYTIGMFFGLFPVMLMITDTSVYLIIFWIVLNGLLHGATDYLTSRKTSELWKNGEIHEFFIVIGLDQLIHAITLFYTYYLILT
jgi:hypothetical protein